MSRRPRRKQKDLATEVGTWLDRIEVADLLQISVNTIMGLERRDLLHPHRVTRPDRRGAERLIYLYDPKEVAKIPRHQRFTNVREPGETAARCFELLDLGNSIKQIVVELRETPDSIRDLRDKWLDAGGADLVISPGAKEALEKHVGPFADVAELIERVTNLAEREKQPE